MVFQLRIHRLENAKGSKRGALPFHEASESHKAAAMKALAFKGICAGKLSDIQSCVSNKHEEQVKRNRSILLSIIDVVIALGQRNVPFHGHQWSKQTHRENGNFDFFIHWKAQYDAILADHLQHCRKNASAPTYRIS